MVDNIDTNTGNDSNYNQTLLTCINDFLTDNSMTRMNYDNTRFTPNTRPSSIDHFYTNVPHKLNNMTTHDRLITDHKIVSVKYRANAKISIPKLIKTRPYHKLTKSALQKAFHMSEMYKAFHYDDPEIIAEIINIELNTIIETIAQSKYKQF